MLVRVDFNVPTEVRGGKVRVTDDTRIRESLPTINYLREHGAKTIQGRRCPKNQFSRVICPFRVFESSRTRQEISYKNVYIFVLISALAMHRG